jgi:hypothetical protein
MANRKTPRKKKNLEPEEKQKLPYIPLYTGDYIKDTRDLSLEAKGAWSDMILLMWSTKSKGVLIGSIDDFTKALQIPDSEIEYDNESEDVSGNELYGKCENFFHGDVPEDLIELSKRLIPMPHADEWQDYVQQAIESIGYQVMREQVVWYSDKTGKRIKGRIDLVAEYQDRFIGIELDYRQPRLKSIRKVERFDCGMVLLRDPKPTTLTIKANVPVKKMVTSSTSDKPDLDDAKYWTDQAISGNDHLLTSELKNRGIVPGEHLKKFALDHLDLAGRYSWPERWTGQQSFRQSLIKHISDELAKIKPQKKIANHISLKGLND